MRIKTQPMYSMIMQTSPKIYVHGEELCGGASIQSTNLFRICNCVGAAIMSTP